MERKQKHDKVKVRFVISSHTLPTPRLLNAAVKSFQIHLNSPEVPPDALANSRSAQYGFHIENARREQHQSGVDHRQRETKRHHDLSPPLILVLPVSVLNKPQTLTNHIAISPAPRIIVLFQSRRRRLVHQANLLRLHNFRGVGPLMDLLSSRHLEQQLVAFLVHRRVGMRTRLQDDGALLLIRRREPNIQNEGGHQQYDRAPSE